MSTGRRRGRGSKNPQPKIENVQPWRVNLHNSAAEVEEENKQAIENFLFSRQRSLQTYGAHATDYLREHRKALESQTGTPANTADIRQFLFWRTGALTNTSIGGAGGTATGGATATQTNTAPIMFDPALLARGTGISYISNHLPTITPIQWKPKVPASTPPTATTQTAPQTTAQSQINPALAAQLTASIQTQMAPVASVASVTAPIAPTAPMAQASAYTYPTVPNTSMPASFTISPATAAPVAPVAQVPQISPAPTAPAQPHQSANVANSSSAEVLEFSQPVSSNSDNKRSAPTDLTDLSESPASQSTDSKRPRLDAEQGISSQELVPQQSNESESTADDSGAVAAMKAFMAELKAAANPMPAPQEESPQAEITSEKLGQDKTQAGIQVDGTVEAALGSDFTNSTEEAKEKSETKAEESPPMPASDSTDQPSLQPQSASQPQTTPASTSGPNTKEPPTTAGEPEGDADAEGEQDDDFADVVGFT